MKVGVIGAGTMGHGIAQVSAMAGYETRITDAAPDAVDRALTRIAANLAGAVARGKLSQERVAAILDRISPAKGVAAAVDGVDLVIEAALEDLDLKRQLFKTFSDEAPPSAILASNTSSLPITDIAASATNPERVIGMHFFNPVHIMKLVELVVHPGTADQVVTRCREIATAMGKQPITVNDAPGFASSRLGVVLGLEAMRMVEQGVASPADIDKAMELGYGHPMGPLRVSDLVGLDVRLAIAQHLYNELEDDQYAPPQILRDKVAAGDLGKKSGKGFYEWEATKTS